MSSQVQQLDNSSGWWKWATGASVTAYQTIVPALKAISGSAHEHIVLPAQQKSRDTEYMQFVEMRVKLYQMLSNLEESSMTSVMQKYPCLSQVLKQIAQHLDQKTVSLKSHESSRMNSLQWQLEKFEQDFHHSNFHLFSEKGPMVWPTFSLFEEVYGFIEAKMKNPVTSTQHYFNNPFHTPEREVILEKIHTLGQYIDRPTASLQNEQLIEHVAKTWSFLAVSLDEHSAEKVSTMWNIPFELADSLCKLRDELHFALEYPEQQLDPTSEHFLFRSKESIQPLAIHRMMHIHESFLHWKWTHMTIAKDVKRMWRHIMYGEPGKAAQDQELEKRALVKQALFLTPSAIQLSERAYASPGFVDHVAEAVMNLAFHFLQWPSSGVLGEVAHTGGRMVVRAVLNRFDPTAPAMIAAPLPEDLANLQEKIVMLIDAAKDGMLFPALIRDAADQLGVFHNVTDTEKAKALFVRQISRIILIKAFVEYAGGCPALTASDYVEVLQKADKASQGHRAHSIEKGDEVIQQYIKDKLAQHEHGKKLILVVRPAYIYAVDTLNTIVANLVNSFLNPQETSDHSPVVEALTNQTSSELIESLRDCVLVNTFKDYWQQQAERLENVQQHQTKSFWSKILHSIAEFFVRIFSWKMSAETNA